MPSTRQVAGAEHEAQAAAWLATQGLVPVQRNFRCRSGEIDLIAVDQESLVFVEVRSRTHDGRGGAAATVNFAKQRRIIRTAQFFLLRNPQYQQWPCRFDVVAIDGKAAPEWIRDAFQVPSP